MSQTQHTWRGKVQTIQVLRVFPQEHLLLMLLPVVAPPHLFLWEVLHHTKAQKKFLMNITSSSVNWSSQPKKKAVNDKALEITDDDVLQEMKNQEHAAAEAKKKKEENKIERERRAKERLKEKERKKLEQE